jgi:hypothetical protein
MYGSVASMIPEWAFGGDYGDISNMLNNRDLSYENLKRQEIANDANAIELEAMQRRSRINDALAGQFQEAPPATIRDAYMQMRGAAFDAGDVGTALDIQNKLENIDKAARAQKISDLEDAAKLAPVLGYARLNEFFPGALTPQEAGAIAQYHRRTLGDGSKEKMLDAIDPSTGFFSQIPLSQALAAQQRGLILEPSSAEKERIRLEAKANASAPQTESGPGLINGLFNWLGSKPGEKEEAQQKAIVENISKQATKFRTYRNKKTGEIITLPEGQKPK